MNESERGSTDALLRELIDGQRAIQEQVRSMGSAQVETWSRYEAADKAYRQELANYYAEVRGHAIGRRLGLALRVLMLAVLVYIAWRVA